MEFCVDEGCPHFGTPHYCIDKVDQQQVEHARQMQLIIDEQQRSLRQAQREIEWFKNITMRLAMALARGND